MRTRRGSLGVKMKAGEKREKRKSDDIFHLTYGKITSYMCIAVDNTCTMYKRNLSWMHAQYTDIMLLLAKIT